jgi:ATP-dependent Zn protease
MTAAILTLRTVTAYHEAAHAVVATKLGKDIEYLMVDEDPEAGLTVWICERPQPGSARSATRTWMEELSRVTTEIQICLAGPLAEARLLNKPMRSLGARADLQQAEALHQQLVTLYGRLSKHTELRWPYRARYLDHLRQETRRLISLPEIWAYVEAIAEELVVRRILSGNEMAGIIQTVDARDGQLSLDLLSVPTRTAYASTDRERCAA